MTKRNVTLQLDEDVIARAKVVAASQGMSMSGLMAQYLHQMADDAAYYAHAREGALASLAAASGRTGSGPVGWSGGEIHDRWERQGQRWVSGQQ